MDSDKSVVNRNSRMDSGKLGALNACFRGVLIVGSLIACIACISLNYLSNSSASKFYYDWSISVNEMVNVIVL